MAVNIISDEALEFFRQQGSIGGKRSAQSLTKAQRKERARRAGVARQAKRKQALVVSK